MTAASLLARGQLVTPFNLSVPAVDAFYIACRNDLKSMPIVRVFVDWLFSEHDEAGQRRRIDRPALVSTGAAGDSML